MANHRRSAPRLIFGVAVILAGILFLLDNAGIIHANDILIYWPVVLILIGLTRLPSRTTSELTFAVVCIGGGFWILLYNLAVIDLEPWLFFWPAVLILIGANLAFGALRARDTASTDPSSLVSAFAFMSGIEKRVSSAEFKGGDLNAIMGGCEIDLRKAKIAGDPPVIHVFAFWGGIDVRIPSDWAVESRVLPLLGAYEDNTEAPDSPDAPRLILKGMAIMGGVEVKN